MSRLTVQELQTLGGGPYSFSVERAECVAVSGPSGCGKTLLLRALADLDPAAGSVCLDGTDRNGLPAPHWRRKVGWLPAESAWWHEGVGDHFPPQRMNPKDQSIGMLQKLGFDADVFGWRVERLSTGEKQRLALFRLLLNEPHVLLLDEPTAALDRTNVHLAEELVGAYRRSTEAAVVWVSHDPEQIARTADRHLRFLHGRLEPTE